MTRLTLSKMPTGCILLATAIFPAQANSEFQPPGEQTWRRVEQFTEWEKERVDLRVDTPHDAQTPYHPAEPYPFTAPFTAEKMGYRIFNFTQMARWSHVMADAYGSITKDGYLTQGVVVVMVDEMQSPDAQGQIFAEPGSPTACTMHFLYASGQTKI